MPTAFARHVAKPERRGTRLLVLVGCLAAPGLALAQVPPSWGPYAPYAPASAPEPPAPDPAIAANSQGAPPPGPGRLDHRELHVAMGGGPVGVLGLRLSVPFGALRLEPGVGIGVTGEVASLVAALRLGKWMTPGPKTRPVELDVYAGSALSWLDGDGGPLASDDLPAGTYDWLDLGIAIKTAVGGTLVTLGGGISHRLSGPAALDQPRASSGDEDGWLWPLVPTGCVWHRRTLPALWLSLGRSF